MESKSAITKTKVVDRITESVFGHTSYMIDSQWDKILGRTCGRSLIITESAKMKLAAIYGWIQGLVQAGEQELAERASEDLFKKLNFLSRYGEFDDQPGPPKFMVEMYSDSCFGSFGLSYLISDEWITDTQRAAMKDNVKTAKTVHVRCIYEDGRSSLNHQLYWFDFNGGLIYHGPGSGSTYSVTLDENPLWSLHS